MDSIEAVMTKVEGYKNLINAVPDPIFGINKNRQITIANKATELLLKKPFEQLLGQFCHDCFCTSACGTGDCPINQLNVDPRSTRTSIIDISTDGKPHFIQPVSEMLHAEHLGDIDVDTLLTRCERTGSPFEKLSISPIN